MRIYWREVRRGERLVITEDDGEHEEEIGGVRQTRRGFDAFARTFGYDPGRAQKDIPSLEEAKAFVESFRPWELFEDTQGQTVEKEVRPPKEA
ncbi:MAG: hypothetical protein ACRDIB_09490 [Ardenticatenaceae bacterium]